MTAAQLRDLFITTLVRRFGGERRGWRLVIGDVRLYSLSTHPHCNWSVTPAGSIEEVAAVERIADDLRIAHPIVGG